MGYHDEAALGDFSKLFKAPYRLLDMVFIFIKSSNPLVLVVLSILYTEMKTVFRSILSKLLFLLFLCCIILFWSSSFLCSKKLIVHG